MKEKINKIVDDAIQKLEDLREKELAKSQTRFVLVQLNGIPCYMDTKTGLYWQKDQRKKLLTFGESRVYAEELSKETGIDWRIPTREELISIVDDTIIEPATELPGMVAFTYWSSSTIYVASISNAWYVNFNNGYSNYNGKPNNYYVRCVATGE